MNTFVERSSCTKSGYAICVAVLTRSCGLRFWIAASSSAGGRDDAGLWVMLTRTIDQIVTFAASHVDCGSCQLCWRHGKCDGC
jgi:hypothetical protein